MAEEFFLSYLDNGHSNIGTMVGYSLAVDEQIGEVYAQLRAAFACAKSGDMLVTYRGCQVVDDFLQRFNGHSDTGILLGKSLDSDLRYFCKSCKQRGEISSCTIGELSFVREKRWKPKSTEMVNFIF